MATRSVDKKQRFSRQKNLDSPRKIGDSPTISDYSSTKNKDSPTKIEDSSTKNENSSTKNKDSPTKNGDYPTISHESPLKIDDSLTLLGHRNSPLYKLISNKQHALKLTTITQLQFNSTHPSKSLIIPSLMF